jgi:glycosyltransferase involved in cell wall biosynthesis
MKPKLLMIVNEFPPVGESGVQRPLKFLKYLDRAGWETHVVTPRRPAKTVLDYSLCKDIPPQTRIHKTFSLGFSGRAVDTVARVRFQTSHERPRPLLWTILNLFNHILFPLDKQIGWVPFALARSLWVIRRHGIRNVYVTAYPNSAFLIGICLKKLLGDRIFWVADYRDAWQFEPLLQERLPAFRKRIIRRWDERTLACCDRAVFVTEPIRSQYLRTYPRLKQKTTVITNGYDEDDFTGLKPHAFDALTFLYMGKFYSLHRPDPRPLFRALSRISGLDFRLVHIGTVSQDVKAAIGDFAFYGYEGYKTHREALEFALGADVNLLLINDDKESEGVYTGKLFELLRAGRPILALGPRQGVARELIEGTNAGVYAHLGNEQEILEKLNMLLEQREQHRADPEAAGAFSRERLCQQLIGLYG